MANIELEKLILVEEKESVIRNKAITEKNLESAKKSLATAQAEIEKLQNVCED
jgi:hypothetical protein